MRRLFSLRGDDEVHPRGNLLIAQIAPMGFFTRHYSSMDQSPRPDLGRPANRTLHPVEDGAQRAGDGTVQLGAVAEPWVDQVDNDVVLGGRKTVDEFAEEESQEQFAGVVAVAGVELLRVVEHVEDAGVGVRGGDLALFEDGPLGDFAADNTQDWRLGSMTVGCGSLGLDVLRLEDGTEGDGHEGGSQPVGLDGDFIAVG